MVVLLIIKTMIVKIIFGIKTNIIPLSAFDIHKDSQTIAIGHNYRHVYFN